MINPLARDPLIKALATELSVDVVTIAPAQCPHERADYILRCLEAAGWQMVRWLPISEAPKDGTLVLIRNASSDQPWLAKCTDGFWRNNHYGSREPIWYFAGVTEFMLIPEPPQ